MEEVKILQGEINVDYKWNPGNIVGKFLTHLRDHKEIVASRCSVSSKVFLPPTGWSPYVNRKIDKFPTLGTEGRFKTGTIVYQAPWNLPEGIKPPYMLAAISFLGADTELLHIVTGTENSLQSLKKGDVLTPVWKEERIGTIRDILYFVSTKEEK